MSDRKQQEWALAAVERLVRFPARQLRRLWRRNLLSRKGSNDLLLPVEDFLLRLRADSVLARALYVDGEFEIRERALIRRILRPGMKAIDVGANIGLYTVMMARLVGPQGNVWSFEPYSGAIRYLRENILLNKLSNVAVASVAISDAVGEGELHVFSDGNDVYNSLGAARRPVEGLSASLTQTVPTMTLDEVSDIRGIRQIDFIKLDIEGAEERAIIGARKLLKRSPNVSLLVELYQPSAIQCGCDARRLVGLMNTWGFRSFDVSSSRLLSEADIDEFLPTYAVFQR